jgi:predicted Zn-dependent peptidase
VEIPPEKLALLKKKIIKGYIRTKQTADSWASIGSNIAFMASPEKFLITNYEEAIGRVTPENIIAVANKYFTNDNWYLAMCGPKSLENIKVKL